MTLTTPELDAPLRGPSLARPKLPTWSFVVIAVVAIGISVALLGIGAIHGYAAFAVIAAVLYIIGQTIASSTVEGWRHGKDRLMTSVLVVSVVLALLPLLAILIYTIANGLKRFDGVFFSHSMRAVAETDPNGGAYNAIIGTLEQVGIATIIAVPFGIMVAIYLVEYSSGRLGRVVSFFVDVMTGLPSIVAGLFIYALWILALHQSFSGFAGSLALLILMLPTVVRSSEEMLKLVPIALREASFALGVPKWKTVVRIVLPTALPGIVTGVMLAISRVMGETAPVLLTVFGNPAINNNPFSGAQASLPLFVFTEVGASSDNAVNRAWAGALTLILIVLVLNIVARTIARFAQVRD
ncbi:MAG TPA: phosphate ABC transporter permease PstA [Pseudonocardiaceae bacterium]|jgi:phosphate transport system permease protein|nr:phosphate ABC transporter permease PstA [Pseudonocardiaceae bacterium]